MVRSYSVGKVVDLYPSIKSDILALSSEYVLVGQQSSSFCEMVWEAKSLIAIGL